MSAKPDGGHAFPHDGGAGNEGMTLRDWFAGQALAGMMADPNVRVDAETNRVIARQSYDLADAMIEARQKP